MCTKIDLLFSCSHCLKPSSPFRTHHNFQKNLTILQQNVRTLSAFLITLCPQMSEIDKSPSPWLRKSFMDSPLGQVYTWRILTGVKLNKNWTQCFKREIFWQYNQRHWAGTTLSVKFSDLIYVYFLRYSDLFDFTLVRWAKWLNHNFSQSRHNLKILRLVQFRLSALVTLSKNFWTRVLGSVVIQLYAGVCTPSVDRALVIIVLNGSTTLAWKHVWQKTYFR